MACLQRSKGRIGKIKLLKMNPRTRSRLENTKKALALHRQGLKQEVIAERLNLSQATISKYLSGLVEDNRHLVGKGIAKGAKLEAPKEDKKRNRRPVKIGDIKNTIIWADEKYSEEEVRERYLKHVREYK